jgi:hypothetical protein
MAWTSYQATLTAAATQLIPPTGGVNVLARQVIIQNNAAGTMRVGDSSVSATKGYYLAAGPGGGVLNTGAATIYNSYLSDFWVFGTSGQVVDILVNT